MNNLNPHISVDCVVFGYNKEGLSVLLIRRDQENKEKYKLPGSPIVFKEVLYDSALRTLNELTGIHDLFLKQFGVFDDPKRLMTSDDLEWLQSTSGLNDVERIVTIAYYSLLNIEDYQSLHDSAQWFPVNKLPQLIFDHEKIVMSGLKTLRSELLTEPHGYELLPDKFSLNQLQELYEKILNIPIDNRNFRKKINRLDYIIPLNEYQKGVSHKPARLHVFDKEKFKEFKNNNIGLVI